MTPMQKLRAKLVYFSCFGGLFTRAEVIELLRASNDYNPRDFLKLTTRELALVNFAMDCDAEPQTVWHELRTQRATHAARTSGTTCYQCGTTTAWLAPDSRCGRCTNWTPEEIRGETPYRDD